MKCDGVSFIAIVATILNDIFFSFDFTTRNQEMQRKQVKRGEMLYITVKFGEIQILKILLTITATKVVQRERNKLHGKK